MQRTLYTQRTQISLSPKLRELIDAQRLLWQESLSEYLRKAAILRIALEDLEKQDLSYLANAVVGQVSKKTSGWKNIRDISLWQKKLRKDENKHRA